MKTKIPTKKVWREDMVVTVPDEIIQAHRALLDARIAYQKALDDHRPICLLQVGDQLIMREPDRRTPLYCEVISVSYDPYARDNFHDWNVKVRGMTKDWKRKSATTFHVWLKPKHKIELRTDT